MNTVVVYIIYKSFMRFKVTFLIHIDCLYEVPNVKLGIDICSELCSNELYPESDNKQLHWVLVKLNFNFTST